MKMVVTGIGKPNVTDLIFKNHFGESGAKGHSDEKLIEESELKPERGITITNVIDKVKEKTGLPNVVIVGTEKALSKVKEELANMTTNDSIVPIFKIQNTDTSATISEEDFLELTREGIFNQLSIPSDKFN